MVDLGQIWQAAASRMDDAVDGMLSDTLMVKLQGENAFTPRPGFVIDDEAIPGLAAVDESLGDRRRVKIRKSIMATPSTNHRIQHERLGPGIWKPAGGEAQTQGRYWIFDVQKASA